MEKQNVLLTIEYDGTRFAGWQRQPAKRTVQGELERVLSTLCCMEIHINGTSRTDAGVHALGQRASFCAEFGIPVERIPLAANNMLADSKLAGTGDIRILKAESVPVGFHARFDARGKKYIYRIRCWQPAVLWNWPTKHCAPKATRRISMSLPSLPASRQSNISSVKCRTTSRIYGSRLSMTN